MYYNGTIQTRITSLRTRLINQTAYEEENWLNSEHRYIVTVIRLAGQHNHNDRINTVIY